MECCLTCIAAVCERHTWHTHAGDLGVGPRKLFKNLLRLNMDHYMTENYKALNLMVGG